LLALGWWTGLLLGAEVSPNRPATIGPAASAAPTAAPAANRPLPTSTSELDDKHKLAIGDRLSFRILEDQEDPREPLEPKPLIVTDSGDLEVPYLGRYPAENKTCKQLAQELKVALEKDYYYQATVIIAVDLMAKSRGKVYIVGPVRIPGPQEIPSDEVLTLSKAIMRAGGFNDFADRKNVKVTRKGSVGESDKKSFIVDVGDILDKGRIERDLTLEPGDIVMVPERAIRF
jgi:polysaccharide biosynthesis/export protein